MNSPAIPLLPDCCFPSPGLKPMRLVSASLPILVLGAIAWAQTTSLHSGADEASAPTRSVGAQKSAAIEGVVVKEPTGEPVKKAVIELITENQAEGGNYTAVTGVDGTFRIEGIAPGRYHLFAERTGLLEKHSSESIGRLLTIAAGQEVKDLQIRLQAAAVLHGRVTDEDGEALANAQVTALRQTFPMGRSHWEQAGSERTNDLGEYRIAGLAGGNYYVSVNPPPDFRSLIDEAGKSGGTGSAANDKPVPLSYQPTYYPGTTDRSQATPLQLHAGDDFPLNFSLTQGPTLSIRGSVVNLPPRTSATIMLQSRDLNLVFNGAEMHKDGSFVIRDVAPGAYTILASVDNSPVPMMARQSLQMVSNSVEGLRLAPQAGGSIRGRLRFESKGGARIDASQFFLTLRSVDGDEDAWTMFVPGGGVNGMMRVAPDGSFEWKNIPPGNYYVQLAGDSGLDGGGIGTGEAGWFLKSTVAEGRDITDVGFNVSGGTVGLDLVASANGVLIDGVVTDHKGDAVANAVIVAVPEARLRGRVDRYRKTVSDQSGHFALRGTPPGDYTLFAWESVEGEAYYDPEFLHAYQAQGAALRAAEGEHKTLQVEVIPEAEDQP
jgi:carboxypeptidase family protein